MSLKPPEGKSGQTPALQQCQPISLHIFRQVFLQLIRVVIYCQGADFDTKITSTVQIWLSSLRLGQAIPFSSTLLVGPLRESLANVP